MGEYENYEQNCVQILDRHAPKKVKILRGNDKLHYNKILKKVIMKRSRLKNNANRPKDRVHIANYQRQSNINVSLTRQTKSEHFNEVSHSKSCLELGFFRKNVWHCIYFQENLQTIGSTPLNLIQRQQLLAVL